MKVDFASILKQHRLRQTETRIAVLKIFVKNEQALSHSDIEKIMGNTYDRVTIYRTLNSFLENGLVHKVLDNEGGVRYALCNHDHEHHGMHSENHIHFKCRICSKTSCLDNIPIPVVTLPKKFKIEGINLLVEGVCDKCEK